MWDLQYPFTEWAQSGDAPTVDGSDFYEQIVAVSTLVAIDDDVALGGPLTATDVRDLETRIAQTVERSPYVDDEPDVILTAVNTRSITISVYLPAEDMDLQTNVDIGP